MATRKVLVATLGHVDHGKTSLLDKIRRTAVTSGEAGGITQAIGVSIIPLRTIEKICGKLLNAFKGGLTVPGLLCIDTPGHAAFTSLRKRGGSLADIAIVVVDLNEGCKPQTLESIEILRAQKVPFIIAANKVDLIPGWEIKAPYLLESVAGLSYEIQGELEKKLYDLVGQLQEHKITAERFDRVGDYTKQVAIIPVSAMTGQGIPELLMVLTGLAQKYLEQQLTIEEQGVGQGTILEVKEEKGMGTTIDVILYNGKLTKGDTIVLGGIDAPLVTKVRALLEPAELQDMRDKGKYKNVPVVYAATGVKVAAPGLDAAIAGMPLRVAGPDIEATKLAVQQEVGEVLQGDNEDFGVFIKADTIGGLEALRLLLEEKSIPIAFAALGAVSKKDLAKLESLYEANKKLGVLLGFNVAVSGELQALCKQKKLPYFVHDVIYQVIDSYELYLKNLQKQVEKEELGQLVRPCKFALLKGYTFRQNNPAIMGAEIEVGRLRAGNPIMDVHGKRITSAKSMKDGKDNVTMAEQGKQIALAMDGVTVGRQVEEGDFLYTDIPEEDFKKLKEFKTHLTVLELNLLREIAEIKRKSNPVWGV